MKKFLKELYPYVIIVVVVIIIRSFIMTPIKVSGASMDDTLADGEVMILNRLGKIEREKIVVINEDFEGEEVIIKRIIGLPGEKIKCTDGVVFINGKKYDDKYAYGITSDFAEIILKDDEYFVMGDNRIISKDSRVLGPVKEKYIEGTTNIVIFPFKEIGKVY